MASLSSAAAQTYQTPVRRALPVESPTPAPSYPTDPARFENPAWMERVRPARPVPSPSAPTTADETPAESPTPLPTPYRPPTAPAAPQYPRTFEPVPVEESRSDDIPTAPAVTPLPMPTPEATPIAEAPSDPEPTPAPEATPADAPGSIRIAPTTADGEIQRSRVITGPKDYGDAFFARKMYDLAIPEYQQYLSENRSGPDRIPTLFRLAESHRILGNLPASEEAYAQLLKETQSGEFAGAAAYRLANMQMDAEKYAAAASNFEIASKEAADQAVQLSALFHAAQCLDRAGDARRAFQLFERLEKNPDADERYRESSLVAMARLAASLGRRPTAIDLYKKLAANSDRQEVQVDANLKAANLLIEEDRMAEAKALLETLSANPNAGKWQGVARFGLLELEYRAAEYEKVAALTPEQISELPEDSQARALLLVANSNRQLNRFPEALRGYDEVLEKYPDHPAAREASFHRLVCLFRGEDPALLPDLNKFLLEAVDPEEIAQARLLKAETHFKAENWDDAAAAYGALAGTDLPANLLAEAAYKNAWSLNKAGKPEQAVLAYSTFLERYSRHALAPQALIGRGLAHQQNGAHDAAIRDFESVIENHPATKEYEVALLQKALAHGARREYPRMQTDFEKLVKEFPDSAARAQAEFWIGYAKFEAENYEGSLPHFAEAVRRDPDAYRARANLRSMLANYYLERPDETSRLIEEYQLSNVPSEVYQWLAAKYLEAGDHQPAEKYLRVVLDGQAGNNPSPELYLQLAQTQIFQKKYEEAIASVKSYLELVREPVPRARGLLVQSEAALGLGKMEDARQAVDDALLLQPEGRLNAQARLLSGKIQDSSGDHAEAAKTFLTIAVLYDDEILTPEALRSAADSYRKANNPTEAENALEELRRRYPKATEG